MRRPIEDMAGIVGALFRDAPFIAAVIDATGIVIGCNSAFEAFCGSEAVTGKPLSSLLDETANASLHLALGAAAQSGRGQRIQLSQTPTNSEGQTRVYGDVVCQPIYDEHRRNSGFLIAGLDNTDVVLAKRRLADLARFNRETFDSLSAHIAVLDEDGTILMVNRAWREFAERNGVRPETVSEGINYFEVCNQARSSGDDQAALSAAYLREALGETQAPVQPLEYPCHSPSEERWFAMRVSRFESNGSRFTVIAHEDITARKRSESEVHYLAYHDALTDLPNRRLLMARSEEAIENARASGGKLGLLYVDIDNFKFINDAFGHGSGDEVLKAVSWELREMARAGDTIARLGGDEFIMLAWELKDAEEAQELASRILEALSKPFFAGQHEVSLGASVGVAVYPDDGRTFAELLRSADSAMYSAKAAGRGTYSLSSDHLRLQARERVLLATELKQAIAARRLSVHYQPKIDLRLGTVVGLEALVRWEDSHRGSIAPDVFVALAEEAGFVWDIDRLVIEEVFRQLSEWLADAGLQTVPVAVNLSPASMKQDIVHLLEIKAVQYGVPLSLLEVEVTERVAMDRGSVAAGNLSRLRAMGCKVALDDFGTGYSSLSYLSNFSFDVVKIDRSFVSQLGVASTASNIVGAIATLGRSLNLEVVAEGVETEAQRTALLQLGCDQGQGFLFSPPLLAVAIVGILTRSSGVRLSA